MTQREASPRPSRPVLSSSQSSSSSLKHSPVPHQANGLNIDKMVESKTIVHIIEILGVVACAHHFWPKGITYGEPEDWEKAHRKRHEHGSKSKPKSKSKRSDCGSGSGSSSSDSHRRSTRDDRRYEDEYDDRPRYSRHASSRY